MYSDASATLGVIHRHGLERLKHVDCNFFICTEVQSLSARKVVQYVKVPGSDNPADVCTKGLNAEPGRNMCQPWTADTAQEDQRYAQRLNSAVSRASQAVAMPEKGCGNTAQTCLGYSTDLQLECCTPSSSLVHMTLTRRREHSVLRHESFQPDCIGSRSRFVRCRRQSLIIHCAHFPQPW